jgi:hypothetical protein
MHSFPLTVVDNFFDDPDEVRRFALAQEYEKDPRGVWPGQRSRPLHLLHPIFFEQTFHKLFSLFYTKAQTEVHWEIDATFQKVDSGYDAGWIHVDSGYTSLNDDSQVVMSGIVYLTPDMPINSGTSIYRLKKGVLAASATLNQLKEQHYNGLLNKEDVDGYRSIHNDQYEETVKVGSIYNRLITFEANQPHAAQHFFGDSSNSRLTLVFFVRKFLAARTPIQRMRHLV